MAINAGQVFVDLGARLDRTEFEAYERELKKVQQRTAKREHFKAELGADFDSRAFNAYERQLKKAERHNDDMVRSNGRLRTSFGSVWSRGGAAFAAAGGATALVVGLKSIITASGDAEASQAKVKTMVENAGFSWREHAKDIDKAIQAHSRLSGFDDEELAESFANMIRTTGSLNEAMKLNHIVTDVARSKGLSLAGAQSLVARVYNGSFNGLKRLGIAIEPVTKAQDELKAKTDHATDAQKRHAKELDKVATRQDAIAKLQKTFAGQTEAYGKTQQGSIDRLGVAWENLREKLGQKLAPVVTRVANHMSKFIDEVTNGTGEGGRFADKMESDVLPAIKQLGDAFRFGGRLVGKFFDQLNSNERQVGGWISGFGRAESTVLKFTGTLVGGKAGDQLKQWGRNVDSNADQIDRWREQLRIDKEVDGIERDIRRLRRTTSGSFRDIRVTTKENMDRIRDSMTLESAAGRRAFGRNIRAAVTAIKDAMKDGRVSAQTGLAQIRKLMLTQLRELGIRSAERLGAPLTQDPAKANKAQRYMGGWLGGRGLVGHDSIPAMLAPGEAVLNRHQQGVIEGLLGEGFLDRLFATVNRPHFMQRGGRALRRFARGGEAGGRFLQLPENIHVTHQTAGLAGYPAQDVFASPGTPVGAPVAGTIARLSGQAGGPGGGGPFGYSIYENGANGQSYFMTHFGSTAVRAGQRVRRGQIIGTVADYPDRPDHIHEGVHGGLTGISAGGGPQGAVAAVWNAITAPRTALGGLLGSVVQGTLDKTTAAVNRRGRELAATVSGVPAGGPGGGTNQANRALGREMAADRGWTGAQFAALDRLWQGESGWSNTARNPSSGAFGIPQALPPSKMGPAGAGGNPRAQIAWGLAYIAQRYGDPANAYRTWLSRSPHWYASGGYAGAAGRSVGRAAAGHGRSKLARTVGGATAGLIRKIRPVQTDRSSRFDALMARVDAAENEYARWERRFNISDEELVDADTGAINVRAIQRKAKELGQLIMIRAGMERDLEAARDTAKAIVASYRKVVAALRKSLRHATRKNRAGIRSYINQYEPRIAEWQGKIGEVGGSLFDARTDVLELKGELKDVLGTTPQIQAPDIPGVSDTGGGTDTGGTDTAEPAPAPPTPLQIAEAAAAEMRTFLSGRQDLLTSFGRNFVPAPMGAAYFNHPDALSAAGGVRAFGGGSVGGGLGGATIVNNYMQLPDSVQTWSEQMRFVVGGG